VLFVEFTPIHPAHAEVFGAENNTRINYLRSLFLTFLLYRTTNKQAFFQPAAEAIVVLKIIDPTK
jgi:hypothetical protein